jgi:hypothetical protein
MWKEFYNRDVINVLLEENKLTYIATWSNYIQKVFKNNRIYINIIIDIKDLNLFHD